MFQPPPQHQSFRIISSHARRGGEDDDDDAEGGDGLPLHPMPIATSTAAPSSGGGGHRSPVFDTCCPCLAEAPFSMGEQLRRGQWQQVMLVLFIETGALFVAFCWQLFFDEADHWQAFNSAGLLVSHPLSMALTLWLGPQSVTGAPRVHEWCGVLLFRVCLAATDVLVVSRVGRALYWAQSAGAAGRLVLVVVLAFVSLLRLWVWLWRWPSAAPEGTGSAGATTAYSPMGRVRVAARRPPLLTNAWV